MIFGRMSNAGKEFVLVGLSQANIEMMKNGEPITVGPMPGDPLMSNTVVIIIVGETEQDMVEAINGLGIVPQDKNGAEPHD